MAETSALTAARWLRIQYGLKFAVSGVLTLYCVSWLRLGSPSWAISSVIVLMIAQYVGAIAEKAFFRLLGTISGAFLGITLTGNFLGNGPLFLTLVFLCVTFLSYMAHGKRAPYAFMLGGFTLLVVVSGTLFAPEKAWEVGISRALNIIVGIIVTLLVSTLLWPRHARVEFRHLVAKMLSRVEKAVREVEQSFYDPTSNLVQIIAEIEAEHLKDIELLQKLLQYGVRESSIFATRIPSYRIIVDRLNRLHSVFIAVAQTRHASSLFAQQTKKELSNLLFAIENECALFRESLILGSSPQVGTLESACQDFRHRLEILRTAEIHLKNELAEIATFAGLATGFLEAAGHLRVLREQLVRLFGHWRYQPDFLENKHPWFRLDPGHLISASKSGLTAVFALIFCNWFHPPGFDLIPAAAWLFIMLPRTYFHGYENQKAIHYAFLTSLIGLPILVLFTFLAPWIANYFYANIFLFVSLFLLGIAYFEHLGIFSQRMYACTLAIAGAVNLCQHWPLRPGGFQNWYFGIIVALGFCAFVQRFFWPPLPQNEFFNACQRYFSGCLNILNTSFDKSALSAPVVSEVFQIAWETEPWIPFLPLRACRPEEQAHLQQLLSEMRAASYQLTMLRSYAWHAETHACLAHILPLLTPLEDALRLDLSECYQAFKTRQASSLPLPTRPIPTVRFLSLYRTLREKALLKRESTPVLMEVLSALCHLEAAACAIWHCRKIVSNLQLENYARDVAM